EAGFKSAWEANIARILNEKNIDWEYEKASESYATDFGYYIPDFKVQMNNKTYIIEVKGFWDEKSVKKVSSALSQAKEEEFIIVDSDLYSLLEKRFENCIPYWEQLG